MLTPQERAPFCLLKVAYGVKNVKIYAIRVENGRKINGTIKR